MIDYFMQCDLYVKENWIDFEGEISKVIKTIDEYVGDKSLNEPIDLLPMRFFNERFSENDIDNLFTPEPNRKLQISFAELREKLICDLTNLTRALEIYLSEYVENIDIEVVSNDIYKVEFDKILSFNYTNTYSKIYGRERYIEYNYIHGKAESNSDHINNMVLGIDEYLSDERKNRNIEFIAFKKYYQRIHKETGCEYKNWIDVINQNRIIEYENYLYIFGHSLDITDGDILRELILCEKVHTIIYYHNKEVHGQQIANLVRVIGQDELIRRSGGPFKTIEFRQHKICYTHIISINDV